MNGDSPALQPDPDPIPVPPVHIFSEEERARSVRTTRLRATAVPSRTRRLIMTAEVLSIVQAATRRYKNVLPEVREGAVNDSPSTDPPLPREEARTLAELVRALDLAQDRLRVLLGEGMPKSVVPPTPTRKPTKKSRPTDFAPWRQEPEPQQPAAPAPGDESDPMAIPEG